MQNVKYTMTALDADTLTDEHIRTLRQEAINTDDDKLADLCRLALGERTRFAWTLTPYAARIRCAEAFNQAISITESIVKELINEGD